MCKKIKAALCAICILFIALPVFGLAENRNMSTYRSLCDENGEVLFSATTQTSPWDCGERVSSDKSFIPDGQTAVYIPYATHKNSEVSLCLKDGQKPLDVDVIKRNGELSFRLYIETSEYYTKRDRLSLYLKNGSENGWKRTNRVYLSENIIPNEWNDVKIPISYFGNVDSFDYENIKYIVINRNGTSDEDFNLYITDLKFCAPEGISFSAKENSGKTIFKWWSSMSARYFKVYEDGNSIRTTSRNSLEYTPKDDSKHMYKIAGTITNQLTLESDELYPYITELKDDEYNRKGFYENRLLKYAENSVIMRVGSSEGYVDGKRVPLDSNSDDVKPYRKDNHIFIPLEYTVCGLGGEIEYSDNYTFKIKLDDREVFCDGKESFIDWRGGLIYAETDSLAETIGRYIKTYNNLVVISSENVITKLSDSVAEELNTRMSYNRQHVYLGSLGYATGIMAHPKNSNLLYCKTDTSGLYLYDRDKDYWNNLMDGIPNSAAEVQSVRSFGLDPNNDNIIYVSGGGNWYDYPNYLIKTEDRGKTWKRLNFPGNTASSDEIRLMGESIAVDPNNSNTVYCGTFTDGLFVSHNAGESWSKVNDIPAEYSSIFPGGVSSVVIDDSEKTASGRSKRIYVGVLGIGIYESIDGGESFSLIEGSPLIPCHMKISGGALYISATSTKSGEITGGFFRLKNGVMSNISPKPNEAYMAFMIDCNNPNMMMVVKAPYRDNCAIYRTYDGGESWEKLNAILNPSSIYQDPINPSEVWWPHGRGMYRINDKDAGNLTYANGDRGLEQLCCTQVLSAPDGALHTLVMDHGHMRSENIYKKASSMKPYIAKGAAIDYCESAPKYMFRVGFTDNDVMDTSGIAISTDGGNTFTALEWPERNRIIDAAVSSTLGSNGMPVLIMTTVGDISTGEGKGLWRSEDFGESWQKSGDIVTYSGSWDYNGRMLMADRVNGNVFYYLDDESLYRTDDSGKSWSRIKTFEKISSTKSAIYVGVYAKTVPGREGGIWVSRPDGIYMSYDFGNTWSVHKTDSNVLFGFGKGMTEDTPTVYLYGKIDGCHGVYISDDMGQNYRRIADLSNDVPANVSDLCGDSIYYGRVYVATGGKGVYCYSDVGIDDKKPVLKVDSDFASRSYRFNFSGQSSKYGSFFVNGTRCDSDGFNRFSYNTKLNDGLNRFEVYAVDESGNRSNTILSVIRYLPEFYKVFYNSADAYTSNVGTYVNVGRYDEEANKRMRFVSAAEYPNILENDEHAIELRFNGWEQYQIVRTQRNYADVSTIKDDGELRFKLYINADSGTDVNTESFSIQLCNDDINDWKGGKKVALSENLALDKWNEVSIPLSELCNDELDESKVYSLVLTSSETYSEKCRMCIKDVYFAKPLSFERTIIRNRVKEEVETVESGGDYTTEVYCTNKTKDMIKPLYITALYDNDILIDIKMIDNIEIKPGESHLFLSENFHVPISALNPNIRTYIWNNGEPMKPFETAK